MGQTQRNRPFGRFHDCLQAISENMNNRVRPRNPTKLACINIPTIGFLIVSATMRGRDRRPGIIGLSRVQPSRGRTQALVGCTGFTSDRDGNKPVREMFHGTDGFSIPSNHPSMGGVSVCKHDHSPTYMRRRKQSQSIAIMYCTVLIPIATMV